MIKDDDFDRRGWEVVPTFSQEARLPLSLINEMQNHREAAGESSWGTRNVLSAFVLSMRPKIFLEIGGHIGSATVVIGAALRANGFGMCYTLEPQQHFFDVLAQFVKKCDLQNYVLPVQMFSTDHRLREILTEPVDMIFLDADHSYSKVMEDLSLCDSILSENGLIFLDDVGPQMSQELCIENRGGVRQALLDFTEGRRDLSTIFLEPPFWLNPCGMALVCKQDLRAKH